MEIFVERVRERAKELGFSHAEIARRCSLTERRFGHYVTGTSQPDLITLVKIAKALNTTPNVLLGVEAMEEVPEDEADHFRRQVTAGCAILPLKHLKLVNALVSAALKQQQ